MLEADSDLHSGPHSFCSNSSSRRTSIGTGTREIKKLQNRGSTDLLDKALMKTPCQQHAECTGKNLTHQGAFAVVLQPLILNIPDPPVQNFKFASSILVLLPLC